jgi:hypothetical protein
MHNHRSTEDWMESTAIEIMNRKMTGIQFVVIVDAIQRESIKVISILPSNSKRIDQKNGNTGGNHRIETSEGLDTVVQRRRKGDKDGRSELMKHGDVEEAGVCELEVEGVDPAIAAFWQAGNIRVTSAIRSRYGQLNGK